MYRFLSVAFLVSLILTVRGVPSGKSDFCSVSSACGVGAICSQAGILLLCTCPDGYEGDAFIECKSSASALPSTSSQPSSSSISSSSALAIASIPTTTEAPTPAPTSTVVVSTSSSTLFNIPVKMHNYELTSTSQSGQQSHYPISSTSVIINPSQIESQSDDILTQYPSAPPTLSHYAHSHFQQRIQAQPIQFGENSRPSSSFPAGMVKQQQHSSSNNQQHQLFTGIPIRQRPTMMDDSNYNVNNQKYYYHDNVHDTAINNRNQYQVSTSDSSQYYHDMNQNTNQFAIHQHQNIPQRSSNSKLNDDSAATLQDYRRRPIAVSNNGNTNNYFPISSSGASHNSQGEGPAEDLDDEASRDSTFIKDPLGKYEKCHTVKNIIVCAENAEPGPNTNEKQAIKHPYIQQTSETRRIDSRPVNSNSNNNFLDDHHRHQPSNSQQHNYYELTSHYPSPSSSINSRNPSTTMHNILLDSNVNSQYNNFHSQFPSHHYPSPDFTSPTGITSTTSRTANENLCQRFCGEESVCRVKLDRPICGCSEGHTGDPTVKCVPIRDSKYDTKSCQKHPDCSSTELCHQSRCIDPCQIDGTGQGQLDSVTNGNVFKSVTCGYNASCRVIEHTQLCSCNDGFFGNPYIACNTARN